MFRRGFIQPIECWGCCVECVGTWLGGGLYDVPDVGVEMWGECLGEYD